MRKYTAEKYRELVENIDDDILQFHMKSEIRVISKVKDSKNKTFIDLGAGYGRVLPDLAKIARNVISLEVNPDMLGELKKRTQVYKNATLIEGDYKKVLFEMKIQEMTGEPDLQKTDFKKGIFKSKTGYKSKWWDSNEIEKIKNYFGGEVVNEIKTPHFSVIHILL